MSCVKTDCQIEARSRAAGIEVADDVAENVMERAAHLEETGEEMVRQVIRRQHDSGNAEKMLACLDERAIECRDFLEWLRGLSFGDRLKRLLHAIVERINRDIFVKLKFRI